MKWKEKDKKNFKESFVKALCQGQTLISLYASVSQSLLCWIQQNLNTLIQIYYNIHSLFLVLQDLKQGTPHKNFLILLQSYLCLHALGVHIMMLEDG